MAKDRKPPTFEITEHIAVLDEGQKSDMTFELNRVSWNDKPPKIELRWWDNKDGEKIPRGGQNFSEEAAERLVLTLLEMGYGDMKEIKRIYQDRRKK